ncbi:hypothetical protein CMI37_10730 [Candidatus Pacearchaeota archaeon]|nr:hypothetical protein [Candidatus Pacearchaeota archaeon]|tara:strand:+ start:2156 stop:2617 length:462 start_codon:yes stop_codon:yes gene_type:complete
MMVRQDDSPGLAEDLFSDEAMGADSADDAGVELDPGEVPISEIPPPAPDAEPLDLNVHDATSADAAEAMDRALDPHEYVDPLSRVSQPVPDPSMRDTGANVAFLQGRPPDPVVPPDVNEEIAVMRSCDHALNKLDYRTRLRVVAWINQRFGGF